LNEEEAVSFDQLKKREAFPPVTPPVDLTIKIDPPLEQDFVPSLKPLGWFGKIIPGAKAKHERLVRAEEEKYAAAVKKFEDARATQKKQLEVFEREYQAAKEDFEKTQRDHNAEIDRFEAAYVNGEGEAITAFSAMLLENCEYPENFPCNFKVGYSPPSKELVIEFELPSVEIVPKESEYRYVRARDSIESELRKEPEIRQLYQDVVAALALRALHTIFKMNRGLINYLWQYSTVTLRRSIEVSGGK
jgi:restriction system protein